MANIERCKSPPMWIMASPDMKAALEADMQRTSLYQNAEGGQSYSGMKVAGVPIFFDDDLAPGKMFYSTVADPTKWPKLSWGSYHDGFGMTDIEKEETHMSDVTATAQMLRDIESRLRAEQERSIFDLMVYGKDRRNPFHFGDFMRQNTAQVVKPGGTVKVDGVEYIVKGVKPAAKVKPVPVPKKDYNTLGVRFLSGPNLEKVYTYRYKKGARLHLGQEIVVPTTRDGKTLNTCAIVVELHKTPQDDKPVPNGYGYVTGTVQAL